MIMLSNFIKEVAMVLFQLLLMQFLKNSKLYDAKQSGQDISNDFEPISKLLDAL